METTTTAADGILLIATSGQEADLLRPRRSSIPLHFGQTWRPIPCHCGSVHRACDPARMTIFVGRPEAGLHGDPRALVIGVVPPGAAPETIEFPVFVPAAGGARPGR
jgi:hypothetical protein